MSWLYLAVAVIISILLRSVQQLPTGRDIRTAEGRGD